MKIYRFNEKQDVFVILNQVDKLTKVFHTTHLSNYTLNSTRLHALYVWERSMNIFVDHFKCGADIFGGLFVCCLFGGVVVFFFMLFGFFRVGGGVSVDFCVGLVVRRGGIHLYLFLVLKNILGEYECVASGIAARYPRVASHELSNYFLKSRICIFGYYSISFNITFYEYLQNRKMLFYVHRIMIDKMYLLWTVSNDQYRYVECASFYPYITLSSICNSNMLRLIWEVFQTRDSSADSIVHGCTEVNSSWQTQRKAVVQNNT